MTLIEPHTPRNRVAAKSQPWLITFADLLSLMLTFFVLLFSMTEVKVEAWQPVVDTLAIKFDSATPREPGTRQFPTVVPKLLVPTAVDLRYLKAVLAEKLSGGSAFDGWILTQLDDRIVISLKARDLFEPGTATLTEQARLIAGDLAELLQTIRNRVQVNAYLAPDGSGDAAMGMGWRKSLERAVAFAEALNESGYDRPIAALGYGDSRYGDLANSLSPGERAALANRIDLAIRQPS